jgi:putative ABC transport system substrate-binding protein
MKILKSHLLVSFIISSLLYSFAVSAEAQQDKTTPLIGYLGTTAEPSVGGGREKAFRQGLEDLGRIEGRNVQVEYRYIEGQQNKVPGLISELLQTQTGRSRPANADFIACG